MSRLYVFIAVIVVALLGFGAVYTKGRVDAAHKQEVQLLKDENKELLSRFEKEQAARKADAASAKISNEKLAALNREVETLTEYASDLEDANSVCLSGADTERLRQLWK